MSVPVYVLWCCVAVASWLALYRLPFADASRRRRMALWLADRSGSRPDAAFAVFATALYLGLGLAVLFALAAAAHLSVHRLVGAPTASDALTLLLALFGTSSLNILCISMLYRARPIVDVPGEIARIRWIASILSLPGSARWAVPAAAAVVEELVFRGAVFVGLGARGGGFALACAVSTAIFTIGQIVLVSTPVQAFVMGTSGLTLGLVGCLLVAATGSILPAVVLHASFAGFYTTVSTGSARGGSGARPTGPPRGAFP
ncbi:CPBP family intramembrane metalloprotease [Actinocrinis puniceicyclus]|uniref:CPBP family intramembrane metalloprotease n=1 Tax=Actinocrinis puniceicyclus TaxID=977794 RepID=A0A8J7WJN4_9ACTN|nr:CPBP family intramembrane glutamic endopeptidase [Actinocrinis puniceicyclus]MBS2963476.1 CPBP family intramembrane metalloprotease [Actinocrinis puniceicyclus]